MPGVYGVRASFFCIVWLGIIAVNKAGIQTSNNFHISKGSPIYLLNTIIIFADKQN